MKKSLLHRLFGLGKIPRRVRPTVLEEGIVLMDEGVSGSITMRNFRSPGRRCSRRTSLFVGSVVLTRKRFWGCTLLRPVISVPLDDPLLDELHRSLEGEEKLVVRFDVSVFHEGWSGEIECRFHTSLAREFLDRLARSAVGKW